MRRVFLSLGVLLGAAAASCDGGESDCDCAEVGCFADMCTKTAFVLAESIPANFGGIAGADQLCAQQAAAAKLPGTYKAWLSDANTGPFDSFSKSTVPYVLPDGSEFASDWEALRERGPTKPIDITAAGAKLDLPEQTSVWTGTGTDGRSENFNGASKFCQGWTTNSIDDFAYVGYLSKHSEKKDWTQGAFPPCTGRGLLYCFQQ